MALSGSRANAKPVGDLTICISPRQKPQDFNFTGGGGVDYLRKTLEMPKAFPWLWDFRTILMAPVP